MLLSLNKNKVAYPQRAEVVNQYKSWLNKIFIKNRNKHELKQIHLSNDSFLYSFKFFVNFQFLLLRRQRYLKNSKLRPQSPDSLELVMLVSFPSLVQQLFQLHQSIQ